MIDVNGVSQPVVLANWTTLATESFRHRVEIAAGAGFDGIGLGLRDYRRISTAEITPREMRRVLDANGLHVMEIESVVGFAAGDPPAGTTSPSGVVHSTAEDVLELWSMADLFGPTRLQAVGTFGCDRVESDAVERFAALCDRAAEFGLTVALEFVPITNVPDAATALSIVQAAARTNAGLCVDSWHHERGAGDLEMLRRIPAELVAVIQVDDGPAVPAVADFMTETLNHREVPGEGGFDLSSFFGALFDNGVTAPISVEVMSDSLRLVEPVALARRLIEATRHEIDRASASSIASERRGGRSE